MSSRAANESKFSAWRDLPNGGRLYWLEVAGRSGWRARYVKEVDGFEVTLRFWQEIYNERGQFVEVHHKYPEDGGHQAVEGDA